MKDTARVEIARNSVLLCAETAVLWNFVMRNASEWKIRREKISTRERKNRREECFLSILVLFLLLRFGCCCGGMTVLVMVVVTHFDFPWIKIHLNFSVSVDDKEFVIPLIAWCKRFNWADNHEPHTKNYWNDSKGFRSRTFSRPNRTYFLDSK